MDTIKINGQDYVRLNDICDILRSVENFPAYDKTDKVVDQISRLMFYDRMQKAETDEERKSAHELPGEFVVCKDLGYRNPNGKRMIFFKRFDRHEALASDSASSARIFRYKSKADHVAGKLGEGWKTLCVGFEYKRFTERMWRRIFGEE